MKILLIALPLLVGLLATVGTIVIGGMFMPRAHTATRSVKLSATPETIWNLITDHPGQASWRKGLKSVERGEDLNGHAVWREISTKGEVMPIEIITLEPPRKMVGRIADDSLPFGGTWTWEVTTEGAGTRIRITEDGVIKPPPFRYIARILGEDMTIKQYLTALATKVGGEAHIEP